MTTPARQPQEYFVTEKQLIQLETCYSENCDGSCPDKYCPIEIGKVIRSHQHTSPPAPAPIEETLEHQYDQYKQHPMDIIPDISGLQTFPFRCCSKCNDHEPTCHDECGAYKDEHDAAIAKAAREQVQPFIGFTKAASLKHNEMVDLMRRNNLKIDDLEDPMQKLAFTFFTEIGEMSHKAEVMLEEYAESLRAHQQQGVSEG